MKFKLKIIEKNEHTERAMAMKTVQTFYTEKEAMDYCMDRPDENLTVMSDIFSGVYEVIDWDKN
jgi:hypothetical protein